MEAQLQFEFYSVCWLEAVITYDGFVLAISVIGRTDGELINNFLWALPRSSNRPKTGQE